MRNLFKKNKLLKKVNPKIILIAKVLISWFLLHSIYIVIDGLCDEKKYSDVAVILGNKVNEDGTLSLRLKKRLEAGINLYKKGLTKKIVVSGGLGKEGFYEGSKMKAFLIKNKIPKNDIIVDNEGNTTYLTALNFKKINKKLKAKTITVVSQYYHITRCKMLFDKVGFSKVQGVHCQYFETEDFHSVFREFFAYYFYQLKLMFSA